MKSRVRAIQQGHQAPLNANRNFRNGINFLLTDQHKKIFSTQLYTLATNGELIKNLLQKFKGVMPANSQLQHGTLRTVHSIDVIQVTIPDIEFKHPSIGNLQLGDIVFRVRQINGRYDSISINLPSKFTFCTPKGIKGLIAFDTPLVKIHWDNHSQTISKIEIDLQNLVLSLDQSRLFLRIRRLFANLNVLQNQGKWEGPLHLNVHDITLTNYDCEIFELRNACLILDLVDKASPYHAKNANTGPTKNQNLSIRLDTWTYFLTLAHRVQLRTAITGLRIWKHAESTLQLTNTQFDIDLSVFDRKVMNFNLDTRYEGLNEFNTTKTINKLPKQLALAFSLKNMPVAAVVESLETFADFVLLGPENADQEVLKRLQLQLAVAGTALRLRSAKIIWDKIHFDLTLDIFTTMAAKSGFISTGVLRICGLKRFLTILGIRQFGLIAGLIKNEQLNINDKCTSFDIAVCPNGVLTVNRSPVFSLASVKDSHN